MPRQCQGHLGRRRRAAFSESPAPALFCVAGTQAAALLPVTLNGLTRRDRDHLAREGKPRRPGLAVTRTRRRAVTRDAINGPRHGPE